MTRVVEGLPVSIQVRLARHARAIGIDPNLVLARFGLERFLYRLSRSDHADRFVLKGALMMLVWLGETLRPTRDADLLGFGDLSGRSLTSIFEEVCVIAVEPDGSHSCPRRSGWRPSDPKMRTAGCGRRWRGASARHAFASSSTWESETP